MGVSREQETGHAMRAVWCALALLVWCVVLRAPTLLRSVIDWDESLYLTIADEWSRGGLPYVAVWDHKPVGIYVIFRIALALFGHSVAAIRIATTLAVWIGAVLIYAIGRSVFRSRAAGGAAAIAYPAFSLALMGIAANTELYFITLNLTGAWLLIRAWHSASRTRWEIAAAGVMFGAACEVKYLAAVEAAYFAGVFLALEWRARRQTWPGVMLAALTIAAATLVAPLAAAGYFWSHSAWDEFWYANFTANFMHAQEGPSGGGRPDNALLRLAFWSAPILACLMCVWWRRATRRDPASTRGTPVEWALLGWIAAGVAEASVTGQYYAHYFLVAWPPLCLLLGSLVRSFGLDANVRRAAVVAVLIACVPALEIGRTVYRPWIDEWRQHGADRTARVAAYVRGRLGPGDRLYVVNDEPIVYFLAGGALPTKYVFPYFLIHPHFSAIAKVDPQAEIARIFADPPRCVVISPPADPVSASVARRLERGYIHARTFDHVSVYCRE